MGLSYRLEATSRPAFLARTARHFCRACDRFVRVPSGELRPLDCPQPICACLPVGARSESAPATAER